MIDDSHFPDFSPLTSAEIERVRSDYWHQERSAPPLTDPDGVGYPDAVQQLHDAIAWLLPEGIAGDLIVEAVESVRGV